MNSASDPLLESLAFVHPFGLRISDLWENLKALDSDVPSDKTFYRARDQLLEHDYIEPIESEDAELFRITDKGIDYLEGEIEELELDLPDD